MSRVSPQLIVFSYHKSGTSLLLHVMTKVCERLGLSLGNHYGLVDGAGFATDVVLLPHSLTHGPIEQPYRAIRMIRDPRDIWVSGYLYHRRCDEEWCTNDDLTPEGSIQWPQVDYSFAHWSEDWKRGYLKRLNNQSYQQNLLVRTRTEGLDFELDGYTGCTLAAMREWKLNGITALDVRLEDVMADFDGALLGIFDHFGFTAEQKQTALNLARSEDVRRMDDAAITKRPQISSREISKWRTFLSPEQIARFEERHGDLIQELGYELASAAQGVREGVRNDEVELVPRHTAESPEQPGRTTGDARIRLSADGVIIRPVVNGLGVQSFVVPPRTARVWLQSRCGKIPGGPFGLGVRVSRIMLRFQTHEEMILADDPRLASGWHDAEHSEIGLWRWTDGSAELPWPSGLGPAVVIVHCTTLAEYALNNGT